MICLSDAAGVSVSRGRASMAAKLQSRGPPGVGVWSVEAEQHSVQQRGAFITSVKYVS